MTFWFLLQTEHTVLILKHLDLYPGFALMFFPSSNCEYSGQIPSLLLNKLTDTACPIFKQHKLHRSVAFVAVRYSRFIIHTDTAVLSATLTSFTTHSSLTSICNRCCFIYNTDSSYCAAPKELKLCFEAISWRCECLMFNQVMISEISVSSLLNYQLKKTSEAVKIKAGPPHFLLQRYI